MRNTTFYWLHVPSGPGFSVATPLELITLARTAGDAGSEARQTIVTRYQRDMYGLGCSLTRSAEQAKDLAQDFADKFLRAEIYQVFDERKGGFRLFLKGWAHQWRMTHRTVAHRRGECSIEGVDVPARGKPLEDQIDILITRSRVSEALDRMKEALSATPHAWEVFDLLHLQQDAAQRITYKVVAAIEGISPRHVDTLVRRSRATFVRELAWVISIELRDPEHMAEEFGVTKELLETVLARAWKHALPRKAPPAASKA